MVLRYPVAVCLCHGLTGCADLRSPAESSSGDAPGSSTSTGTTEHPGEAVSSVPSDESSAGTETNGLEDTGPETSTTESPGGTDTGGTRRGATGYEDTGAGLSPNATPCESGAECESGFCFPLSETVRVCSDCETSEDCPDGECTLGVGFAVCSAAGALGSACQTDAGCQEGLECTKVFDTDNFFYGGMFCSECGPSTPCSAGTFCVPQYDLTQLGGALICVEEGSVVQGDAGVDAVCASGHCFAGDILLLSSPIGVCGGCGADSDCAAPQACAPPELGTIAFEPSACQ